MKNAGEEDVVGEWSRAPMFYRIAKNVNRILGRASSFLGRAPADS